MNWRDLLTIVFFSFGFFVGFMAGVDNWGKPVSRYVDLNKMDTFVMRQL